jgi:histidinol-phosphatase
MNHPPIHEFLEFAVNASWQAGRVTLAHFHTNLDVETKADASPVTIADRQAEQKLRDLIQRYWPDHGILGEEFGRQPGTSSLTWILDPIDGTKSFIHGVPLYAVLMALVDGDSAPLLGVIHFPALNETIYAGQGEGCFWDGRRAHVSQVSRLDEALLLSSELNNFVDNGRGTAWQRLIDATPVQRTWGDAYGYSLVATGRAELMVDAAMAVWDCAPLQVVLEEAGGTFTDWQGTPTIYGGEALATNGALFPEVMKLVR